MTTRTAQDDKALVLRFDEEFWSKGNPAAADELMTPDAVIHQHQPAVGGVAGLKAFNTTFRTVFPIGIPRLMGWSPRGTGRLALDRPRHAPP